MLIQTRFKCGHIEEEEAADEADAEQKRRSAQSFSCILCLVKKVFKMNGDPSVNLVLMALTAWRENRGGGKVGMQSVINVIINRARRDNNSPYYECVHKWQFSSISASSDPELVLWPVETDPQWAIALQLAESAIEGDLPDITGEATLYYAPHAIKTDRQIPINNVMTPFPQTWNSFAVEYTATVQGQVFFKEVR